MRRPQNIGTRRAAGQHALSLDVQDAAAVRESDVAPLPERFDLDGLADNLHLDGEEIAWFSAVYLDGMSPANALRDRLRWNRLRADRIRKRVIRKLARYRRDVNRAAFDPDEFIIRGSSLHLVYEERLPSGQHCYTMAQLDHGFEAIMNAERTFRNVNPKTKTLAA